MPPDSIAIKGCNVAVVVCPPSADKAVSSGGNKNEQTFFKLDKRVTQADVAAPTTTSKIVAIAPNETKRTTSSVDFCLNPDTACDNIDVKIAINKIAKNDGKNPKKYSPIAVPKTEKKFSR